MYCCKLKDSCFVKFYYKVNDMILEYKRRSSSILIYPWYLSWNISRNCYLHLLFCYYFVKTEDTIFYFILCINNLNFNVFIIIEWFFFFFFGPRRQLPDSIQIPQLSSHPLHSSKSNFFFKTSRIYLFICFYSVFDSVFSSSAEHFLFIKQLWGVLHFVLCSIKNVERYSYPLLSSPILKYAGTVFLLFE